jgi:hypothetical protein
MLLDSRSLFPSFEHASKDLNRNFMRPFFDFTEDSLGRRKRLLERHGSDVHPQVWTLLAVEIFGCQLARHHSLDSRITSLLDLRRWDLTSS